MKNSVTQDFVDEKGNKSELIITSDSNEKVNLKPNYKLQRPDTNNKYMKKGAKGKGTFTSDIGVKSEGFAPIFTLALIIVLGAIAIAFLMWRL
ncbi:MAG: hypothetical protein MR598_05145 [Erysipelotrichaceae bacterium]|nr:hypothetical protein [Erysipelotrichaceae bacterium]